MPGPTGELNRFTEWTRPPVLCLGPGAQAAKSQAEAIRALGGEAVELTGTLKPEALAVLDGFAGAIWWGDADTARAYEKQLARREGPILPLVTGAPDRGHAVHERHLCVDTTAAGGNAELLAKSGG
jgi:RHH-type proline utilization regulon transcriptional repressor/proline dehydrogenase/delta 1-pyrroline-5-carboxylate dehydrogenase